MKAWNADPVVLTVAPTGSDVTRENNPNIPYTPAEIAASERVLPEHVAEALAYRPPKELEA